MKRRWMGLAATMVFVGACGGDEGNETPVDDTGADVADTAVDSSETDGGEDATDDTSVDSGADAEADAGEDILEDTIGDAGEDASEDAAPDVVEVECGTDTPAELAACVDGDRWWADMESLAAAPRPYGSSAWSEAAALCATRLEALGYTVDTEPVNNVFNVIGRREGTTRPDELVIVGAHYDSPFEVVAGGGWCTGADDNASGVAGALEMARVLAQTDHARTLVVACWDNEEAGLQGSQVHAREVSLSGDGVAAVIALEMIAFGTDEPDSQSLPDGFNIFFEDAVNEIAERGNRGDFLAAVGDSSASVALQALVDAGAGPSTDVVPIIVPPEYRAAVALADLRRSDHAPFWDADLPAIMLTDTADFRNPNYHCEGGDDDLDAVNRDFGVASVQTVVHAAAILLAESDDTLATGAGDPRACNAADPESCGEGQKCSFPRIAAVGRREQCLDITGDVGLDEPCEREEFGVDNCAPGFACTRYGQAFVDGDADPVCRPYCESTADCTGDERCVAPSEYPWVGLCAPPCSPADRDACIDGTACFPGPNLDGVTMGALCAGEEIPGGRGGACEVPFDCPSGYGCAVETGTCELWCDDDHPCPGDTPCTPWGIQTDAPGLGFCIE